MLTPLLPLTATAFRFFAPMTAPRPQRPPKLCLSTATQAIATLRSPAGPTHATLNRRSPVSAQEIEPPCDHQEEDQTGDPDFFHEFQS
jgi:hypothetical protein